jgi:hypothetical protein
VQGNLHAPFGRRTTEKDLHHRHLAGAPLHSASGLGKRARSNPGTAPQADSTCGDSHPHHLRPPRCRSCSRAVRTMATMLGPQLPKVEQTMRDAKRSTRRRRGPPRRRRSTRLGQRGHPARATHRTPPNPPRPHPCQLTTHRTSCLTPSPWPVNGTAQPRGETPHRRRRRLSTCVQRTLVV